MIEILNMPRSAIVCGFFAAVVVTVFLPKRHGAASPAAEVNGAEPEWLRGKQLAANYSGGIALIFEHRCVRCHRPGEVAPMSFMSYNEVRHWAGKTNTPLESLIQTRAMPPWPADPNVGEFSNSLFLTKREMDLVLEWIRRGLPRGENSTISDSNWVQGWNIGTPDQVFDLPKYTVPADREFETKEFVVDPGLSEDRWVVAAEVRPGNESIVARIDAGPFGSFNPGNTFVRHTTRTGRLVSAGQKIAVRIQYEKGAGAVASDQSRIGIVWAKSAAQPLRNLREDRMAAGDFTIPANAADFEVKARFELPAQGELIALMPIMNLRGKDVRYRAILPDGSEKPLLAIPAWDPNWKYRYQLQSPIAVPKGTIVEATAHFDNSDANIRNPDPASAIRSGPQTELFEGWISYVLANDPAPSN